MDNRDIAVLIPILVPLGVFAMVFGIRYLENQERMAMIAKGMPIPEKRKSGFNPSSALRNGLILMGAGLGLLCAIWIDHTYYTAFDDRAQGYYFALIAIGAGIGLLGSYAYERKNPPMENNTPKNDDLV